MKWGVLILGIIFFAGNLFAQDAATISGRILDKGSGEPLPFASITLIHEQEEGPVSGTISDDDGRFILSGIAEGNYFITCSFIGYQSQNLPVLIGELNKVFDLGKIELDPSSEMLDEVTIQAKQEIISSDLDRKTYAMEDNIAQSGGSVLDAMKGLPGITVTQEGKVMLRGSDKVAVLIDGKQSSLTGFGNQKGLDNIPSSTIQRIEIINNPSAKYDASGMAGIINIIYRKENETGFNGDIGFAYGLGVLSSRKKDLPTDLGSYRLTPKYIPSLNLNYKTSKINLFINSEVLHQKKLPNNEFTTRSYMDGRKTASQVPENRKQTHYIVKGGLDWFINNRNSITLSSIYDYESHIDTAQVPFIDLSTSQRYRFWTWSESEVTGYMNYTLNYLHKFIEPGHELNVSALYTKGWEDEYYYLNDSSEYRDDHDTTHIDATEHTINISADYVKPMKRGRLEAGVKFQFRRIPVDYTIGRGVQSVIYPGMGDWSEWGENIYAGYGNYIYESKKIEIEAGLRIEQTKVYYNVSEENIYYLENDAYDYFDLFPNMRLSFKINGNNSLSIFYNRRVDRPGEPELRVFAKYDDPELLKAGNPYLRPQFTQTFEVAYKYKWQSGSLFMSLFHRIIDDPFTRIYAIDTTSFDYDLINKVYQNVGSATNTGIEALLSQNIGDFWKMSGSFNYYNNRIAAFQGTMLFPYQRSFNLEQRTDKTWDMKISNQLFLPGEWQIQLTGIYYAPSNISQGKQLSRSSIDLGIKKKAFHGRGEFILSFTDMFNDFGIKQEIKGEGFDATYQNFYETQMISLGFKYKF